MASPPMSIQAHNRAAVLHLIRSQAGVTRSELIARTGLSRSTVAKMTRELLERGVIVEEERKDGTARGRPASTLRLARRAGLVGGLDFGHSHLRAAIATADGTIVDERTVTLATDDSPHTALRRGASLLEELAEGAGVLVKDLLAVGVGLPAPIDPRIGRVSANGVLPNWVDTHPAAALEDLTGVRVLVDNDANLGALAEHRTGGAPAANLIYVKIASGVGAGLVLAGELYRSTRGAAGELGHVRVPGASELCRCGGRGCLETMVSAPRIVGELRHLHPALTGIDEVVELVRAGDLAAIRSVTDAGHVIGRALADLCSVVAPDCVVLGGQVSQAGDVFLDAVRREVWQHTPPAVTRHLRLRVSHLADRAEIAGAIALAADGVSPHGG